MIYHVKLKKIIILKESSSVYFPTRRMACGAGKGQKEKASEVMGTFVENPFFLSLCREASEVNVPLFDGLPVHTITHLGNYGDSYLPFFPIVLLELPPPPSSSSSKDCPVPELVSCLKGGETECFVVAHSQPTLGPCQHFICENENEMNLMFHPWVFRGCIFNELFADIQMIEMGVFGAHGIQPVHQDLPSKYIRGVPFDVLEEREVSVHNQCFSPANAQVQLQPNTNFAFFFSLASAPSRQIITLHFVPLTNDSEATLLKIAEKATTLLQLCKYFVKEEEVLERKGGDYLLWFLEWVGGLNGEEVNEVLKERGK